LVYEAVCYNGRSNKYWFFNGKICWSKKYGKEKNVKGPYELSKEFLTSSKENSATFFKDENPKFDNFYAVCKSDKYWFFFKGKSVGVRNLGTMKLQMAPLIFLNNFPKYRMI